MRIATVVLPVPGLPVKHMCRTGSLRLQAQIHAQPVDHQQRGDVADAALDRLQPDQIAIELVHHRADLALRQHAVHRARLGGALYVGALRSAPLRSAPCRPAAG